MELTDAILQRRSIRGFRPDPIPQETLRRVIELASRAVSAQNTQPWEFAVVTGEPLEALRRAGIKHLLCVPEQAPEGAAARKKDLEKRKKLLTNPERADIMNRLFRKRRRSEKFEKRQESFGNLEKRLKKVLDKTN